MQTEARVGVVNTGHGHGGGGGDTTSLKFNQQKQELLQVQKTQIGTVSVACWWSCWCFKQDLHCPSCSSHHSLSGFRAFWKGNLVTVAHHLPYSSLNFYAYEQYKKLLYMLPVLESHGENMSANLCIHFIGGGLAGITAASAMYPLDLVRTRLAAQTNVTYYTGISHALQTICKEEGVLGLYKGLGATLLGVGPNIAISFSVYEGLRSFWQSQRPHDSTVLVSLSCGSLSGIASSTAIFPLDLIRRRKQLEGAGGRARVYTTVLFGTFKHIFQTEGFRGLYRGILPEYYKVVPGVVICFMTYETLKMLLADVTTKL
ncbi:hypothetical protein REPUB_Repub03eG0218400 [Reevesia pubescens]